MKVDLKLTTQKTFNDGDLLICSGNNTFVPISKEDLLKDLVNENKRLRREIDVIKQFLKVYQGETTKLLKGVLNNG